jgi:hypothetical protein
MQGLESGKGIVRMRHFVLVRNENEPAVVRSLPCNSRFQIMRDLIRNNHLEGMDRNSLDAATNNMSNDISKATTLQGCECSNSLTYDWSQMYIIGWIRKASDDC